MSIVHAALKKAELDQQKKQEPFRLSVDEILALAERGALGKSGSPSLAKGMYGTAGFRLGMLTLVGTGILIALFFAADGLLQFIMRTPLPRKWTSPIQAVNSVKVTPLPYPKEAGSPKPLSESSKINLPAPPFFGRLPDKYRLTGIVSARGSWVAMINDKVAEVGDVVDGAKVLTIEARNVILESSGKKFQISLD